MIKISMEKLYDKLNLLEDKVGKFTVEVLDLRTERDSLKASYDELLEKFIVIEEELTHIKGEREVILQKVESILSKFE